MSAIIPDRLFERAAPYAKRVRNKAPKKLAQVIPLGSMYQPVTMMNWFEVEKRLPKGRPSIRVGGYFKDFELSGFALNCDTSEGPFVQGQVTIPLGSVQTDTKQRDISLTSYYFGKRTAVIELQSDGQSLQKIQSLTEQQQERRVQACWEVQCTALISLENPQQKKAPLEREVIFKIEHRRTATGLQTHLELAQPFEIDVSDLELPWTRFLEKTGHPKISTRVILDWSCLLNGPEVSPKPKAARGSNRKKVLIAGAGIAGMAAAQVLRDKGFEVTVVEKEHYCGGKTCSFIDESTGHTVEHGIHGVFPSYLNLKQLLQNAGIPDSIYSTTQTIGVATGEGMAHVDVDAFTGLAPFFLLRVLPKGSMKLFDFLSAIPFIFASYAARYLPKRRFDYQTFRGFLQGLGVSKRFGHFFLFPYVRNLAYARAADVSAAVAIDALNHYLLTDPTRLRAQWLRSGPGELIFDPWRKHLAKQGVRFRMGERVEQLLTDDETHRFLGFAMNRLLDESKFPETEASWVVTEGEHVVALHWHPEQQVLRAFDGRCTHAGCPLRPDLSNGHHDFRCDCHGGIFDKEGKVKRAPPKQPLLEFPTQRLEISERAYWRIDISESADEDVATADYGILALPIPATQSLMNVGLHRLPSLAHVKKLGTTSVSVLRLYFLLKATDWTGPDSGVFSAGDMLDNFFVLNTFQDEFRVLQNTLVVECHIGNSVDYRHYGDAALLEEACLNLNRYFCELSFENLDVDQSRVLHHDRVFSMFAPGNYSTLPAVAAVDRPHLYLAGDWVDPGRECFFMERAAVTGIEAANHILRENGIEEARLKQLDPPSWIVRAMGSVVMVFEKLKSALRQWMDI